MKRILVTGASGHAGGMVLSALEARGLPVRAAATRPQRLEQPGREVARLDFTDARTWPIALLGCDAVFLLRPPALTDMELTLIPFLDTARASGVTYVVFLSVAGAAQRSWVPHVQVERHLEGGPPGWTILRPGFFAQNLEGAYARDLLEDGRLYVPAGDGRVAFLDVLDVGAVVAELMSDPARHDREHLTLTGPEALTFDEVAARVSRALGRPITYRPATPLGYVWHLVNRRELPLMQALVQAVLHVGLRRGDAQAVDRTVASLLGRDASSLEAYLARLAPSLAPPD